MKHYRIPRWLKPIALLSGLAAFSTGCSSTYTVSSTGKPDAEFSHQEMIEELAGRDVTIELKDGISILAKEVKISNDSASWVDVSTTERTNVATSVIKKIVIKSHGIGALEGMGIGILIGGTGGIILGSSGSGGGTFGREGAIAMGVIVVGGAGLVVGLISGATIGHSYEYEYQTTEQNDSLQNGK